MVAKLSNGLYGVVDTDDKAIIPFYHSQIDLYKMSDSWVYVGTTLDIKKVYKDTGELYSISNKIDVMNDIIVCNDFIIMYELRDKRDYGRCIVFDKAGDVLIDSDKANIVNNGYCNQLINYSEEVLIDNINECKKY